MPEISDHILQRLKDAVGPTGYLDDPNETEPYAVDARELYHGKTPLVLRPATTAEVSTVVRICAEARAGDGCEHIFVGAVTFSLPKFARACRV